MLTRKQKKNIEELVRNTIDALNTKYENSLPKKESAAAVVKSILAAITQIPSYNDLDKILGIYPEEENNIRLLVGLRFPDTAFDTLNDNTSLFQEDRSNKAKLGSEIAAVTVNALRGWLSFQDSHIMTAKYMDEMQAGINANQEQTAITQARINEVDRKIAENNEEIKDLEIESEKSRHTLNLMMNRISNEDRQDWINNSPFKAELIKVQRIIKRLDSRLVYDGRSKAAKIKIALNNAIDAALQNKMNFNNFNEFKNYKKVSYSLFSPAATSLDDALSIHRFEKLDKLFRKTPKSKI